MLGVDQFSNPTPFIPSEVWKRKFQIIQTGSTINNSAEFELLDNSFLT